MQISLFLKDYSLNSRGKKLMALEGDGGNVEGDLTENAALGV